MSDTPSLSETALPPDTGDNIDELVRRSGTSFYWAMRILPAEKRQAMFAVYAFCRAVDDIADGEASPETKRVELQAWRRELSKLYSDNAQHPVAKALCEPVKQYALEAADFSAIVDGMETDAVEKLRLADDEALTLYCDRVACAVGRLSTAIFGVEREIGRDLAKSLGEALQLTNILRDVDEDAAREHVYLPTKLLEKHGIEATEANEIVRHPQLYAVCEELSERAERRFEEARDLVRRCNRRVVRPAVIMLHVYYRLLKRLQERGWKHRDLGVRVSKLERIWIALRIFLLP